MPIYSYKCMTCGKQEDVLKSMKESSHVQKCSCGSDMNRDYKAEKCHCAGDSYRTPIISDSLAMAPSQITEHKKRFPDIKVTPQGQPVFENYKSHNAYLEKRGLVKLAKGERV